MKELNWGETPWDNKTREALLRDVQRMYSAIVSLHSALKLTSYGDQSGFWGSDGTGGLALEKARQVLEPIRAEYSGESIFRAFFRYANDLLFDHSRGRLGYGWVVCPTCGTMVGETIAPNGDRHSSNGEVCRFCEADPPGRYRPLEWADLAPRPPEGNNVRPA